MMLACHSNKGDAFLTLYRPTIWQTISCHNQDNAALLEHRVKSFIEMGGTNIRINLKDFSEFDVIRTTKLLSALEQNSPRTHVEILLDLPYPRKKCRIHLKSAKVNLLKNDRFHCFNIAHPNALERCGYIDSRFFDKPLVGCTYFIGDGEGALRLERINGNEEAIFFAQNGFELWDNKAISPFDPNYEELTQFQSSVLVDWISRYNIQALALSFIEAPEDIITLQNNLRSASKKQLRFYAKIENNRGLNNITKIASAFDGLIIARGDLVLNSDWKYLLDYQKKIKQAAIENKKELIYATDILTTLSYQTVPSRAELIDFLYILRDQPSGLFLKSDFFDNETFSNFMTFLKNALNTCIDG